MPLLKGPCDGGMFDEPPFNKKKTSYKFLMFLYWLLVVFDSHGVIISGQNALFIPLLSFQGLCFSPIWDAYYH